MNFDYVILDTAPIGMVTDTLLIGRVADLSVYVCRADYNHKAEYIHSRNHNVCHIRNAYHTYRSRSNNRIFASSGLRKSVGNG